MPLRDQPYLPLYIQDFMTDEKLIECSAATTGIYIRIMCILHKQDQYGKLLLKQKYKQTPKQTLNFATQFATSLPYNITEIEAALSELLNEKVLHFDETNPDIILQKRMVRDNEISEIRAKSGSKGGKKTTKKFASKFAKAKSKAKHDIDIDNESDIKNRLKKHGEIIFPFDSENFKNAWQLWKDFKKEQFNFSYKTIGEQGALVDLAKLSGGDESHAIKLIHHAIGKNWKGIYQITETNIKNGQSNSKNTKYTAEDAAAEIRRQSAA